MADGGRQKNCGAINSRSDRGNRWQVSDLRHPTSAILLVVQPALRTFGPCSPAARSSAGWAVSAPRFGIGARARTGDARVAIDESPEQAATLDLTTVTRLAEVVLPGELGDDGFTRVSRGFTQWIDGVSPGRGTRAPLRQHEDSADGRSRPPVAGRRSTGCARPRRARETPARLQRLTRGPAARRSSLQR